MVEVVLGFFQRLIRGRMERGGDVGPGEGAARLSFRLRIEPVGPMAPMIDAMMQPAMAIAAEELANRIIAHLETRRNGQETPEHSSQRS